MKAKKVITEAPVAKPSRPSVKLTPLLVAVTIRAIQITTTTPPRTILVSRTTDKFNEIGVKPELSANLIPKNPNVEAITT